MKDNVKKSIPYGIVSVVILYIISFIIETMMSGSIARWYQIGNLIVLVFAFVGTFSAFIIKIINIK